MKKILLLGFACLITAACLSQTSVTIDPRVKKHYSEEQLKQISENHPVKIKELNFYYSSSFIIHNGLTGGTVDPMTVDVTDFDKLRKEDKRVITGLSRNGATIELLSWNELKIKYQELAASKK
jgi:hypothetical protein